MTKNIYVNLPVRDLGKTKDFFKEFDFKFESKLKDSDENCMKVGDNHFVMFLPEEDFKKFTKKDISDTKDTSEVIVALEVENKAEVNDLLKKAKDAGGKENISPHDVKDSYQGSFQDLDGHIWEFFCFCKTS